MPNSAITNVSYYGERGWLKDKFGLSWHVCPVQMGEILGDPVRNGRSGR